MSTNMDWSPDFCLACDRQTDGAAYCSEVCRLAEYEKSVSGSEASSPAAQQSPISWPSSRANQGFYLPPAYNFGAHKAQSSWTTTTSPRTSQFRRPQSSTHKASLTPSTSQSSLFSMQSSTSTLSEPMQLSDDARKELRGYASSFDQSRCQRRQSA